MAPSFMQRLFGNPSGDDRVHDAFIEPKRLLSTTEATSLVVPNTKASSYALLPRGAYGSNYSFFSPDGGRTMIDLADGGHTVLAFLAYWYVATRWRAQKIAEAPLMVVEEDQDTGAEEWLPDHELVDVLDMPSDDYDMGELLECTSHYLDNTGAALWVMDTDNVGRVARLTPFSRNEFEPKGDGRRLYASFDVQTADGTITYGADTCCFFRDAHGTAAWGRGRSRLDVALSWLRLGAKAQATIKDLLENSVWPSAVMVPDKDWDPDEKVFEQYKQDLEAYAHQGNKGKPFVALGGGSFTALTSQIKDIVPSEILNRVESVIAAISGVPAIVLQYQVGMENSPWSQMAQARRMAYDDTIVPSWRRIERVLTRQMLRPMDDDTTHYLRFDKSNIDSLQRDQLESVQIASLMGRAASLNERRTIMGLEPVDDPKAEEIPELTAPSFEDIATGLAGANTNPKDPNADPNTDPNADPAEQDPPEDAPKKKYRALIARKFRVAGLQDSFRADAEVVWQVHVSQQLHKDRDAIIEIVSSYLTDAVFKSIEGKARGKERAMSGVSRYLNEKGKRSWTKAVQPLATQAATRSGAVVAADMNVNYNLLHPNLVKFSQKRTAELVTGLNKTTRTLVNDIVTAGLEEGRTTKEIANVIRDATGFSKSRASTIARTETTKAFNGAPEEALAALGEATGRTFTKTWSGLLDEKERDEHVTMEGETVAVGEEFSNGLQYPEEPNCRCSVLFDEVEN